MAQVRTQQPDFHTTAQQLLAGCRAAVTELLQSADLVRPRPADIGRELGIDKTLAWKIARFIGDHDPVAAARHLPGRGGVEIVIEAAVARGAARTQGDAARDADETLRSFMKRHAGDRGSFEAMLGDNSPGGRVDLEHRRAYFRAGAALWGARARLQLLTLALRPSQSADGMLDVIQLGGLCDLERLRTDVPWIVRRLRAANDSESERFTFAREPLMPASGPRCGDQDVLPLMPRFCSTPLPVLRQFEGPNGWIYDEIVPGPVGRDGAVTCITGEIHRAVLPYRRADENTAGRYSVSVRTPVEAVLFDLLLHRDLEHFGAAELSVFSLLEDRPHSGGAAPSAVAMYAPEQARPLGAPPSLHTSRQTDYVDLVETALAGAGWEDPGSFRGYRTEMEHPPFPCDLTMVCEIGATG